MKKAEVYYLMAHLIITLAILIIYGINLFFNGERNQTLETILFVIVGYWFGAVNPAQAKLNSVRDKTPSEVADTFRKKG